VLRVGSLVFCIILLSSCCCNSWLVQSEPLPLSTRPLTPPHHMLRFNFGGSLYTKAFLLFYLFSFTVVGMHMSFLFLHSEDCIWLRL
jgi:hypothetical protein